MPAWKEPLVAVIDELPRENTQKFAKKRLLSYGLSLFVGLSMILTSPSHSSTLACAGKLMLHEVNGEKFFSPIGFSDLRIIPTGGCSIDDSCTVDIVLVQGETQIPIKASWKIGPLCSSVVRTEENLANGLYNQPGSSDLYAFDLLKVESTRVTSGESWTEAQVTTYFPSSQEELAGVWEGEAGGGGVWLHSGKIFRVFSN